MRPTWPEVLPGVVEGGRAAVEWWASWTENGHPLTLAGATMVAFDDDGLVARITDFWPEPAELPASRAHLVERY